MFSARSIFGFLFIGLSTYAVRGESLPPPQFISVPTAHSCLTLCVETNGRVYQLGYGSINTKHSVPKKMLDREMEFLPAYGNGFILEPAIQATHADGNTSTDLIYVSHDATNVEADITLTRIHLKDRFYPFYVNVYLEAYAKEDVIKMWTEIRQDEKSDVTLYRFASASPSLKAKEYYLTQFHGDWAREGEISEERLTPGLKILDSKIGVRASQYRIPSVILALDGPAKEDSGQVFGGSLEWSGSYQLAFDVDWNNRLRALAGINPFASQYHLPPEAVLDLPPMLWTWSDHGKGQVSRNFHDWARRPTWSFVRGKRPWGTQYFST